MRNDRKLGLLVFDDFIDLRIGKPTCLKRGVGKLVRANFSAGRPVHRNQLRHNSYSDTFMIRR